MPQKICVSLAKKRYIIEKGNRIKRIDTPIRQLPNLWTNSAKKP
jgi:hypothetical protein